MSTKGGRWSKKAKILSTQFVNAPKLTFFQSNDDFTDVLEEFENIKNWDMIKDADNLESTKSKMGPFADDWSINDDFYLVKGQLISE